MDPSGCGKTSSLPHPPTSGPPWVTICCTAVKTSATAIDTYHGKKDEVIPQEINVCVSSMHLDSIIIRNQEIHSMKSRTVYMQMHNTLVCFALSKSTCALTFGTCKPFCEL